MHYKKRLLSKLLTQQLNPQIKKKRKKKKIFFFISLQNTQKREKYSNRSQVESEHEMQKQSRKH
jgi:hypothetical protein